MPDTMPCGIPLMSEYDRVLAETDFRVLEEFSDRFLQANASALADYGRFWVNDPLHQWSRQWEYLFVFREILKLTESKNNDAPAILDVGSGITFFPFLMKSLLPNAQIGCLDNDARLVPIYDAVNATWDDKVGFRVGDIVSIDAADSSYDLLYCISVLEHTEHYARIIEEFDRILKPEGVLLLTFDISLDGDRDIPVQRAQELLGLLSKSFAVRTGSPQRISEQLRDREVLTSRRIAGRNKRLLPWRHPLIPVASQLVRGRLPARWGYPDLTCYCGVFHAKSSGNPTTSQIAQRS